MEKPQVLVCQQGARRRYAVPRMFQQEAMLAALYTNSSRSSFLGRCAAGLGQAAPPVVRRLAERISSGVPQEKIYSSDAFTYCEILQKLMRSRRDRLQLFLQRDRMHSHRMIRWGLQNADIIYSMYYENLDFVCWAKSQGVKCVVDVYINPQSSQITNREYAAFPDWGGRMETALTEAEAELWRQTAELSDILVCPSEWVAEGVRSLTPAASPKIRIVPYGCSIDFGGRVNSPVKGRILFAGGYALRKGLHYLAQAATRLKPLVEALDVRVAGLLPEEVVTHPLCKDLTFLGKLTGPQMKQEFLSADCFVLPSLSEGFAGVVAEAIAAGCPVIVTRETGSPIEHKREGLVVPARNVEALVDAVLLLTEDREFRQNCSVSCLEQMPFYSEEKWRKRLVAALD